MLRAVIVVDVVTTTTPPLEPCSVDMRYALLPIQFMHSKQTLCTYLKRRLIVFFACKMNDTTYKWIYILYLERNTYASYT